MNAHTRFSLAFILALISIVPSVLSASEITLLPSARIIEPFTANAIEHRMSLAKAFDQNMYIGSLGGVFPLVSLSKEGRTAELSLAGTFYTNLSAKAHQYEVTNGDYYIDALLDLRLRPSFAVRLGMGHTSQHLMDDALEVEQLPHSINYVRDYIQLFAVKDVPALGGFFYAGAFYNYTFIINTHRDNTMIYELGGEAVNYPIARNLRAYIAADIKLRGESSFGTSQNYQLGVKLSSAETTTRAFRVALNYQTGLEERGQFYNRRVQRFLLGLYFDL